MKLVRVVYGKESDAVRTLADFTDGTDFLLAEAELCLSDIGGKVQVQRARIQFRVCRGLISRCTSKSMMARNKRAKEALSMRWPEGNLRPFNACTALKIH